MPRQRRGAPTPARSAPTRPTAPAPAPAASRPHQQQQQPHSTAATAHAPPPAAATQPHAPVQQTSAGSGMLGQIASTAAGVAIGSTIGHALGGLFGGGSSSAAPAETHDALPQSQAMDTGLYQNSSANSSMESGACATDVRNFRSCMDENQGNLTICGWYLDQLKACQAAAKPY